MYRDEEFVSKLVWETDTYLELYKDAEEGQILVIAVKPQVLSTVFPEIRGHLRRQDLVTCPLGTALTRKPAMQDIKVVGGIQKCSNRLRTQFVK